ncbi:MAG: ankyrin repeat domain-containing protein [Oligoflexia bacterium]|nr:ankyrin repeat domain-containing protein [Oligoflexia bacterium]
MWKYLTIVLLFLASLVYAGYYLYRFDKKNSGVKSAMALEQPAKTIESDAQQAETPILPPHLTEDFWKTTTPQELEQELKTISSVNEVRPDDKKSMLHLLVEHGSYPEMVKMLIDAGVDYKLKDEVTDNNGDLDNRTALFYSVLREEQAFEFTQALLEYDDVNSFANTKATVLITAVYNRVSINIVQLLLEKGADPNIKILPPISANALITASAPNLFTGESYINPQVIQLLLDHNVDITAKDDFGRNALDYMKENKEFKKTELFKKLSDQFSE